MKWLDRIKRTAQPTEPDTQIPYDLRGADPTEEPSGRQTEISRPASCGEEKTGADLDRPSVLRLSPREKEVFCHLLDGWKMKDIAAELGIKASTVNGYCREIYRALGVNSKAQLIIQYAGFRNHLEQKGVEPD